MKRPRQPTLTLLWVQSGFHFHLVVVDGLFEKIEGDTAQDPATNPETHLRFHEATALTHELLEDLQQTVRRRVLRHMVRHVHCQLKETGVH